MNGMEVARGNTGVDDGIDPRKTDAALALHAPEGINATEEGGGSQDHESLHDGHCIPR